MSSTKPKTNTTGNFLDGWFNAIRHSGDRIRDDKRKWNKDNPPTRELSMLDANDQPCTIGLWLGDKCVLYAHRDANGYNPCSLQRLSEGFVDEAHRLLHGRKP